jgi:chromosome partitioning protein
MEAPQETHGTQAPAVSPLGGAGAAAEPPRKPRTVALLNQKGGVGKTTSTVNLGAAFARYGQRVLLVDLDPQSNLSLHFGVECAPEQRTVRDLLLDPECRVQDCVQRARPGLDFVPAVTELALVEGELAQLEGMQTVLRDKLREAWGDYDVVLLDCPPSLGVLSVNALTVADEVFVPMQAHYLPLRGLEKLLQTVHLVSQGLNPSIRVSGILLCMHDGSSSHARAVIGEIESQLEQFRGVDVPWSGAAVLDPAVRRNIKLAEAPSFGKTIFDYAPQCPGADDYRRLALGLIERWGLPHGEFEGMEPAAPRRPRAAKSPKRPKSPAKAAAKSAPKPRRAAPAKGAASPKSHVRAKAAASAARPKAKKVGRPARAAAARGPAARAAAKSSKRPAAGRAPRAPARTVRRATRTGRSLRSGGLSL